MYKALLTFTLEEYERNMTQSKIVQLFTYIYTQTYAYLVQ